ncbi:hypothetical protein Mal64_05570 [Pseudobythopirellula maris]|uniref:DUF2007 domain-containing protein n=1 Tax=Pseudobythopirellula maris TaxID=2527991 RepID=A0A5C5ZVC8_9BACT|nr:hypothetical protein [Pseudobythopirellula maris]TWT90173.1 hypothetical protein Mal64_05570 [Pseudobythopirellula maris]
MMRCTECGGPLRADEISPASTADGRLAKGRVVAGAATLAEAGYLASVLQAEGIESDVLPREAFDAASGSWSCSFVLRVAQQDLARAEELAHSEAAAFNTDDETDGQRPAGDQGDPYTAWRPLVVVTVVGAALFAIADYLSDRQAVGPRAGAAQGDGQGLAAAVGALGEPLLTPPGPGGGRSRLSLNHDRGVWVLESDADGDGLFERRRLFPAPTLEAAAAGG